GSSVGRARPLQGRGPRFDPWSAYHLYYQSDFQGFLSPIMVWGSRDHPMPASEGPRQAVRELLADDPANVRLRAHAWDAVCAARGPGACRGESLPDRLSLRGFDLR